MSRHFGKLQSRIATFQNDEIIDAKIGHLAAIGSDRSGMNSTTPINSYTAVIQ